jgi:hypothetical protein
VFDRNRVIDVGDREPEARQPVRPQPTPPATAGVPATPPPNVPVIDVAYIAKIASDSLPNNADLNDFVTWSTTQLPDLTQKVIAAAAIDTKTFNDNMTKWFNATTQAESDLNKKNISTPSTSTPSTSTPSTSTPSTSTPSTSTPSTSTPSTSTPSTSTPSTSGPPMPGTGVDTLCMSTFDANDLALRGRKSVKANPFHLPIIFPQFKFKEQQSISKWMFGQKIEYLQEWRHDGFTLGDLISSISLLPNEELTLELSTWQKTKTEAQQETDEDSRTILENQIRTSDERSVTNEAAVSNSWSVSASGSLSFGPVSASADVSASGNTEQRTENAEKHLSDATRKATNEISMRRAIKLTQTAEAGSEQRTTRRIKNPNSCHTVTYTFFQIIRLIDVQLRLANDAPMIILPGLFPDKTSDGKQVEIPYSAVESFTSPAVFLTQFFEIDRDISQEIWGWGLRVRMDAGRSPGAAITQLAQALIVAAKYLLKLDPSMVITQLGTFISNYVTNTTKIRQRSLTNYGVSRGRTEQITTEGIYADSMIGRCSACEVYIESSRYEDVMLQNAQIKKVQAENALADLERKRREMLIAAGKLTPF